MLFHIIPLILMATNLRTTAKGAFNRHASKHRSFIGSPSHPPRSGTLSPSCSSSMSVGRWDLNRSLPQRFGQCNISQHCDPTWAKTKPNDDADTHHGWVFRKPGDEPLSNSLGHGRIFKKETLRDDNLLLLV